MKIYLLGNIADVQTGPFGSQLHKEDYVEFGTPMVTVEHLGNRVFTKQNLPMISDSDKKRLNKYVLNEGDIVFSRVGSVDRCSYVDNKHLGWMFSGRCLRIRPRNVVYPLYLYYYFCMENTKQFIRNIAVGATMPSINTKLMEDLKVPLPTMEMQQKIASILSALDDKIELNNRINENLESQAQAIFKSWFVDFEPFGGVMPEDWKIKDIYSIANIIYGAPFKSKLFNTEKDGKPIVRIRDLKSNELTTFTTEIHPKGYLIQNGDIVVGMDGEFKPYIWGNNEAWLNQRVCVFDNIRENGKFFLYLTIKPLLNIVEQTEVATTVIHIGKSDFDSFEINLPNENILDKFDTITMPIYKLIVKNKLENKRLAELRDTLLPKLMNGEIDVSKVKI